MRVRAIGRLGESNFSCGGSFRTVAGKLPQPQSRQPILTLARDKETLKEIDVLDHDLVAVSDPLRPVLAIWRGNRRRDQPEIPSAIVGADEPQPVAVVDRVFVLILARRDQREAACRFVRTQHPRLARRVAARLNHNVLAISRPSDSHVEALVVILIDQHIGRCGVPSTCRHSWNCRFCCSSSTV